MAKRVEYRTEWTYPWAKNRGITYFTEPTAKPGDLKFPPYGHDSETFGWAGEVVAVHTRTVTESNWKEFKDGK